MSEDFIYYKNISNNSLDLKLSLAKDSYKQTNNACKYIEQKAQHILTASLAILTVFSAFVTCILKNLQHINSIGSLSDCILSIFMLITAFTICFAGFFAIKAFNPQTIYYIGKKDILNLNNDEKRVLIEKYINYSICNNSNLIRKNKYLKISYSFFLGLIFEILIYSVVIAFVINSKHFNHLLYCFFNFIKQYYILLIFIIILVITIIILYYKNAKNEKFLIQANIKKEIEIQAYYNHINYPNNSPLENWLLAEKFIYMRRHNKSKY